MSGPEEENGFISNVESGRTQNLEWCSCGNCRIESESSDCKCCWEVEQLNARFVQENITCIRNFSSFNTLFLDKTMLEMMLRDKHFIRGDPIDDKLTNRSYRVAAYKQFNTWAFRVRQLGKRERRGPLPSCVVARIRKKFPETDGNYGY
ncbi:P2X purinoceptor 7-like [Clytia hemisphaerica]|uniref:P2X purinoreceptor 7 intracellular domain-containing protein n=1 Tax=Clytia hemisphaerica TaxID=252671 RepID=A0A7M5V435_9CNID